MGLWQVGLGGGQGPGCHQSFLSNFPVCSVAKNLFEVKENTNLSGPLVTVDVPQGQQVTLAASSTPFAFRIQGNQLFLNVTPDYEVQLADPGGVCPWGWSGRLITHGTQADTHPPSKRRALWGSLVLSLPRGPEGSVPLRRD